MLSRNPLMVFKSLNGLAPEYLSSKFIDRSKTTSYTFRDSVSNRETPFGPGNDTTSIFEVNFEEARTI